MAAWLGALTGICSVIVTVYKVHESDKISKVMARIVLSYERTVNSYRDEVALLKQGRAVDAELERQRLELEQRKQTLEEMKTIGGAAKQIYDEWKESQED